MPWTRIWARLRHRVDRLKRELGMAKMVIEIQRDSVRVVLNSPTFADKARVSVYHELLEAGTCCW